MGLIYSVVVHLILNWNPIETKIHGSVKRLKISNNQLIIQDESHLPEQTLGHFAILPNEMITYALSFLEIADIINLSSSCKLLYKLISSSDAVWERILQNLDLTSHQIRLLQSNSPDLSTKLLALQQHHELRIIRPLLKDYIHVIKVAVLGASGVGKTQLVNRLKGFPFDPAHNPTTTNMDTWTKFRCSDNTVAKVAFYDSTPSLDGPGLMSLIRNCQVILVVFDVTQLETFQKCDLYFNTIEWALSNFHVTLIGTHSEDNNITPKAENGSAEPQAEITRQVWHVQAKNFAHSQAVEYFEVSLKSGEGVPELLDHLVFHVRRFSDILRRYVPVDIRA